MNANQRLIYFQICAFETSDEIHNTITVIIDELDDKLYFDERIFEHRQKKYCNPRLVHCLFRKILIRYLAGM